MGNRTSRKEQSMSQRQRVSVYFAGVFLLALSEMNYAQSAAKSIQNLPFSANEWITKTFTASDGTINVTTQQITIARASDGVVRLEIHEVSPGTDRISGKPVVFVSTTSSDRQSVSATIQSVKAVTSVKFPEKSNAVASSSHNQSAALGNQPTKPQVIGTDLGTSEIDGFRVIGRRTEYAAPTADRNAKPSKTISEIWYSPDLQMVLKSSTIDAANHQVSLILTDIKRAEPDLSHF